MLLLLVTYSVVIVGDVVLLLLVTYTDIVHTYTPSEPHPVSTPCIHTLYPHPVGTPCIHTLYPHPVDGSDPGVQADNKQSVAGLPTDNGRFVIGWPRCGKTNNYSNLSTDLRVTQTVWGSWGIHFTRGSNVTKRPMPWGWLPVSDNGVMIDPLNVLSDTTPPSLPAFMANTMSGAASCFSCMNTTYHISWGKLE